MKHISDELRFIGTPISDDDPVSYILNGLDQEYNSFIVAITIASQLTPLTYSELHAYLIAYLLAHEARLQGQLNTLPLPSITSPLVAFSVRPNNKSCPKTAN
jgi:gag-polypeptide of LTR copia-type